MKRIALIAFLFLSACASGKLGSLIGEPISTALLELGEPEQIIEMEDGTRAYQWSNPRYRGGLVPNNLSGGSLMVTRQVDCFYTLIANYQGNRWVVVDYIKPKLRCE